MRAFFQRMNPTVRGFLIILAIVLVIVVLQLESTLIALSLIAQVAFLLAIAFFVFLVWRERRADIAAWPRRASVAFYAAAIIAVADIAVYIYGGAHGLEVLAFVGILALCGFAMFRIWRDQHHYI
jgi:small-conductance mechanosensitive channel